MRFQTVSRPLRELVHEFHHGTILLPQFQRDYVWKPAKIRNLLDSLLKGFPIGGFYLWRPISGSLDPKPKALGQSRITDLFAGYLIDGQQRLTSLEAAFGLYTGEDKRGTELRCYLDLAASNTDRARDTLLFVSHAGKKSVAWRIEEGDSTLIPVALLFTGQDYDLRKKTEDALKGLPDWTPKRVDQALQRFDKACAMLDQLVPCTTISDIPDKDAVEVFSRLNKGGTALLQGDVRAAELARGHAVAVLKQMRRFVAEDRPKQLGFGFSFAFRALVLFHRESAQFNRLRPDWIESPGPHGRTLAQSWRATERALSKALEFVDKHMGWSRRALLPSANAVIVLAAALDKDDLKVRDKDIQHYQQWLCLIALRGVFQGSVETTINRFHRAIRNSRKRGARALLDALKRNEARQVHADELNTYALPWGPMTQVIHAWLASREAQDWLNAEPLDKLARGGSPSLPGGELTVHHIFPRKYLASIVENPNDANSLPNYALLSRATNSEFGDRPPDEVLATLTPAQRKRASMQFFDNAAGDRLRSDGYEDFCEWRAGRLAEALNDWLGVN